MAFEKNTESKLVLSVVGTGTILAKIDAEKDNPSRGCVVWRYA